MFFSLKVLRPFLSVEVDLSDENGNVKNLRDSPNRYADEILADRENLVLLKVDSKLPVIQHFTTLWNTRTHTHNK